MTHFDIYTPAGAFAMEWDEGDNPPVITGDAEAIQFLKDWAKHTGVTVGGGLPFNLNGATPAEMQDFIGVPDNGIAVLPDADYAFAELLDDGADDDAALDAVNAGDVAALEAETDPLAAIKQAKAVLQSISMDYSFSLATNITEEKRDLTLREWLDYTGESVDNWIESKGFNPSDYDSEEEAELERAEILRELDDIHAFIVTATDANTGRLVSSISGVYGDDDGDLERYHDEVDQYREEAKADAVYHYIEKTAPLLRSVLNKALDGVAVLSFPVGGNYGDVIFDDVSLSIRFLKDHRQLKGGGYHAKFGRMGDAAIDVWYEQEDNDAPVLHVSFNGELVENFIEENPDLSDRFYAAKEVLEELDELTIEDALRIFQANNGSVLDDAGSRDRMTIIRRIAVLTGRVSGAKTPIERIAALKELSAFIQNPTPVSTSVANKPDASKHGAGVTRISADKIRETEKAVLLNVSAFYKKQSGSVQAWIPKSAVVEQSGQWYIVKDFALRDIKNKVAEGLGGIPSRVKFEVKAQRR